MSSDDEDRVREIWPVELLRMPLLSIVFASNGLLDPEATTQVSSRGRVCRSRSVEFALVAG